MNVAAPFSYSPLPGEQAAELRVTTGRIKLRLERSTADIVAIGLDLISAKNLLGHGEFALYLAAEFSMTQRTAERFITVAERFGKIDIVSNLPATALYELAAPSTRKKS